VLSNLELMVVKEVHGAGGYGMLVGPRSTKEEREAFRQRLLANPANYIAQDTLALSTCPTFVDEGCRRGISIYVPTCCPGRRCGWCPAA
jgi:uncharacterized circularly permuted ATP-grasp superfamily protein